MPVDNHQTNLVERLHVGDVSVPENGQGMQLASAVIYNQFIHSSTGVQPNRFFLGTPTRPMGPPAQLTQDVLEDL